jgi:hypothetical protein
MTPSQVRVADPVLSAHARGYRRPGNVATKLFPIAPVSAYGGKVVQFGRDAFRVYNTKRSPGAATKRIRIGYDGKPFHITPSALEAQVPWEHMTDATQVPRINLASRAVNLVLGAQQLEHEYDSAQIARDLNNYDNNHKLTLAGAARWTNPATDPSKDISTAKTAISDTIGIGPNRVLLSKSVFDALEFHPKILERIKYTSRDSVTTDILAKLWNVDEVVVGAAVVATGPDDVLGRIWGDDVILAYTSLGADVNANIEEPSYGYTYAIEGMPMVEEPYSDKNTRSWIYQVANDAMPVLSGMEAGFLLKNAGAPHA